MKVVMVALAALALVSHQTSGLFPGCSNICTLGCEVIVDLASSSSKTELLEDACTTRPAVREAVQKCIQDEVKAHTVKIIQKLEDILK